MRQSLRFHVAGKPQPAGSKKAYVIKGRAVVTDANAHSKPWQRAVQQAAAGKMLQQRQGMLEGPLFVQMIFYRERPASHLKKDGTLNAEGQRWPYPSSKPDVLKLARGVEDALTGVVYEDDARIVGELLWKEWGEPGVAVLVAELDVSRLLETEADERGRKRVALLPTTV